MQELEIIQPEFTLWNHGRDDEYVLPVFQGWRLIELVTIQRLLWDFRYAEVPGH